MSASPLLIGIGEVLWDLLPPGGNWRRSGEFRVPRVGPGAHGAVVSRVGDDELGRDILRRLDEVKLDRTHVSIDAQHPTGVVNVTLDSSGVPTYDIKKDVAWDFLPRDPSLLALATSADAVCFGTLGQRSAQSRESIRAFLDATRQQCLRVFDINLRQHYYSRELIMELLKISDVLKLNDQELPTVAALLNIDSQDVPATARAILQKFPLRLIALTRGPGGSLLVQRDGQIDDCRGFPTKIADTVGAGDAFTAALTLGLLKGHSLQQINVFANRLAAYVCSRHGAMPGIPEGFLFFGVS